jgi:hypothetical protein
MILCLHNSWIAWCCFVAVAICSARVAADDAAATQKAGERLGLATEDGPTRLSVQTTATPSKPAQPAASPAEVAAWIVELDDNRYLARERASQQLLEAGSAALDPLLAAANGERPEPADRAVWILRRLSKTSDRFLRRQALERLTMLQNRPEVAAAARETLVAMRHQEALEAIQRLGGRYRETAMVIGTYALPRVIFDQQWRGGDDGLAHVQGLAAVGTVAVIGTDISAEGLTELQNINGLQDLVLYGTTLEPADVEKLQKLLPHVKIDYRRGALLGVASTPNMDGRGSAVVASVQPGSAAEAAGIRPGDIIQNFENEPVPNFDALTRMIGKHRAGDEVTLEVLRDGQPIEFKVSLGAWQTFD